MAARLVRRCTCLLREATRLAPAVSPVGQLRLPQGTQKPLTSSATSPSSRLPGLLSELVEKEQVFTPYTGRQEVEQLIEKATQPEELLELLGSGHCLQQPKSPPTRRVPPRGTPRVPAPLPLSPFSPPDRDRRGDSPACSGRGSRPSRRTSG